MGRWEPNAKGRLAEAAMELYLERGYEQTTVNDIAARAGLTARTFFRYFADKREVLFAGSDLLQETMVAALESAPPPATAIEAVAAAIGAAGTAIGADRDFARRRQAVIVSTAELQERELMKLEGLAAALVDGLRRRGVAEPEASLAAQAGIAVFRVAFERWVSEAGDQTLPAVMHESFDRLRSLTR